MVGRCARGTETDTDVKSEGPGFGSGAHSVLAVLISASLEALILKFFI